MKPGLNWPKWPVWASLSMFSDIYHSESLGFLTKKAVLEPCMSEGNGEKWPEMTVSGHFSPF